VRLVFKDMNIKSSPKVIWEECITTPTSENALSHCAC